MAISKEDQKTLDTGITITVEYDHDSGGVYLDEDKIREEFEDKLEQLLEIDICKCGFCGEELEDDVRYCSSECYIADNTERV